MENDNNVVVRFCRLATATPEQAKFFLESAEWQLETAVQLFLESDEGGQPGGIAKTVADYDSVGDENVRVLESELSAPGILMARSALTSSSDPVASATPPELPRLIGSLGNRQSNPKGKEVNGKRNATPRDLVTTLRDLKDQSDSDSDSEGQEYYTGGEKSGMVVLDPSKKHNHHDVESLLERVRKSGADGGDTTEPPCTAASVRNGLFSGPSHTLSGKTRQLEPVAVDQPGVHASPEPIVNDVRLCVDGFDVNADPLRRLDNLANTPSLEGIHISECPRELESPDRSNPVNVNLTSSKPKCVAFQGTGRTVGSSTSMASADNVSHLSNEPDALPRHSRPLIVDEDKPASTLQLRLLDGARVMARFNNDHTVADVRSFIDAVRPGSSDNYQLQTVGFPPEKLTNLVQTIEAAGLGNAVIIQKR